VSKEPSLALRWLFLHPVGLETLVDRPAFTRIFDELRLVCVCPHTAYSWWTDRIYSDFDSRISAERHILENVVPYFESRWGLRPPGMA